MKERQRIDIAERLGTSLLSIAKPSRYLGGELGSLPALKSGEDDALLIALSFPDLYEIGMSNNAVRLLYDGLNRIPGIRCERVFAPAPDFEELLSGKNLPLTTLESGIALCDADLLGFSVGYELAATSILTILERGGITLRAADRRSDEPIVIAGGPAVSNPHYISIFLDAVYVGEAEDAFFAICADLTLLRRQGASRIELLETLAKSPHIWIPGKKATRAIYSEFPNSPYTMAFPVPVLKTVQSHGTVEIMRGCPHGCRFCNAGFFYRPQRMKSASKIQEEVRTLIERGGYNEITLASLSSGDYEGIGPLLSALNSEWGSRGVSFQLPSLKVNTFTLPLIEALSELRKSGLTFAVESPEDFRQLIINKDVSFDKLLSILTVAKAHGFKTAKFYFMIGLPVPGKGRGEAEAIIEFFAKLTRLLPLAYNVNVGIFVPKPHTPFQWCGQLDEETAMDAIRVLKDGLRPFRSVHFSWHSPFVSQLESIFARGDERVGVLILEAWKRGARLDAWEEHFDRELWRAVLSEASWDPIAESNRNRNIDESFPWDDISIRVSKKTLQNEWQRSQAGKFTSACTDDCRSPCGSCSEEEGLVYNIVTPAVPEAPALNRSAQMGRLILRFTKLGPAIYYPHLGMVEALERALMIVGVPMSYSEGFNPAPRLELTQPLALGLSSREELAQLVLCQPYEEWSNGRDLLKLAEAFALSLPRGFTIRDLHYLPSGLSPRKAKSIGSLQWGSRFLVTPRNGAAISASFPEKLKEMLRAIPDAVLTGGNEAAGLIVTIPNPAKKEEGLLAVLSRAAMVEHAIELFQAERIEVLAKGPEGPRNMLEALLEE